MQPTDRPNLLQPLPDQTLAAPNSSTTIDLSQYFADPNGSTLSYTVSLAGANGDADSLLQYSLNGDQGDQLKLTSTASSAGWVTVTVTAADGSLTTADSFSVNLLRSPGCPNCFSSRR